MKFTSLLRYGVVIAFVAISGPVFSKNKMSCDTNLISTYEKNFNFDWNNSKNCQDKTKINKIESYISTITDFSKLTMPQRESLGKLFYKLGTYYAHVSHAPDVAIERLRLAEMLLLDRQDKAWNANQLAFAFEQKYAASGRVSYKTTAFDYLNRVTHELYPNTSNKEVAFAYYVQGLILNDAKDFEHAKSSYKVALAILDQLSDKKDQLRVKNQLNHTMLAAEKTNLQQA